MADVFRLVVAERGIVVIDIPIGLPDNGPRACDTAARAHCYPRHNSVFSAPCRVVLSATTYADACRLNLAARGKAITKQLFGILPKIAMVDSLLTPHAQPYIREAHPEVSFAAFGGTGRGMEHYKKTSAGEQERSQLLMRFFGSIDLEGMMVGLAAPRSGVSRDDVIDALACLATAQRIRSEVAMILPDEPVPRDSAGLRMEIVA